MNREQSMLIGIGVAGLLTACRAQQSVKQPNIIIILADDMGYSDLGCYGSEINTPNIDKLAQNGIRFTNFYNAARSCPSRASLLTGLYPHQAGMGAMERDYNHPSYRGHIEERATTIAEVLAQNGYNTYHVGKWHVGEAEPYRPLKKGFQKEFTLIDGASSYYNLAPYRHGGDSGMMTYNGKKFCPGEKFYMTDAFTGYAERFIREDDDKPFFMYLAYTAPHWPLHALPEDINKYKGKYMIGWDSVRMQRYKRMLELGVIPQNTRLSDRPEDLMPWDSVAGTDRELWDARMAVYAAMIDRMDQGIGRIIELLRNKNEFENTLIIFLSDNGGCPERMTNTTYPTDGAIGSDRSFPTYWAYWANVSNTPYRYYKAWVQEGGIKTPFIAHWPEKIAGGQMNTTTTGHIMDLMATVLDVAGAKYPLKLGDRIITPTPGLSLLPAFIGKNIPGHDTLCWEHEGAKAIKIGEWKLVCNKFSVTGQGWNDNTRWQLFNLKDDPSEILDVTDNNAQIVVNMKAAYRKWADKLMVLEMDTVKMIRRELNLNRKVKDE